MLTLGWTRGMVKRSLAELELKDYISFRPAANQHELGTIKILKFDLEEDDSARLTSEPSNSSISQKDQGLRAHKNAVEVKKEKTPLAMPYGVRLTPYSGAARITQGIWHYVNEAELNRLGAKLDPALKGWIDRVIVPGMVRLYVEQTPLPSKPCDVADSRSALSAEVSQ